MEKVEAELSIFETADDLLDPFDHLLQRAVAVKALREITEVLDMTTKMREYAALLKAWKAPRIDVVETYGVIAAAVYADIATGSSHYETIERLLHSCSSLKFLQLLNEKPLGRGKKNWEKESFPDVRKNTNNFFRRFSNVSRWPLSERLYDCHMGQKYLVDPPIDWQGLVTKLERSR